MQNWSYQQRVGIHLVHMARKEGKIRESIVRCSLKHVPTSQQLGKREERRNAPYGDKLYQLLSCAKSMILKHKQCGYCVCLSSLINFDLHFLFYLM